VEFVGDEVPVLGPVLRDELLELGVLGGPPVAPGAELPLAGTALVDVVHVVHLLGGVVMTLLLLVVERSESRRRQRRRSSAEEGGHPGRAVTEALWRGGSSGDGRRGRRGKGTATAKEGRRADIGGGGGGGLIDHN